MSPFGPGPASQRDVDRYLGHVESEREAAALYRGLAQLSGRTRRGVFTELAEIEDRHAQFWVERLRAEGVTVPAAAEHKIGPRTATLLQTARRHSLDLVLPVIEQDERDGMSTYLHDPDAPEHLVAEEAEHARVLGRLLSEPRTAGAEEAWHRNDKSGALRASIFGINDGLVSNTALVMGFAGAATDSTVVLFAGLSGLLAGAFSMGAGEYISMANQREAYEREIALERDEIEFLPADELRELELIYLAKGLGEDEARTVATRVMADKNVALDTMVREELGLDPDDLGSPWRAAASSFASFALGAMVVVLPYLFLSGTAALLLGISLALLAMIVVGAGMAKLNGRPRLPAIGRQIIVGVAAAGTTYLLGSLIGATLT
ncbi:MAG: VIT1/CCC1 transporter family protein [Candidatus Nanopelagicales bacterium]